MVQVVRHRYRCIPGECGPAFPGMPAGPGALRAPVHTHCGLGDAGGRSVTPGTPVRFRRNAGAGADREGEALGREAGHLAEWWGHEVAAGFRLFEPSEVAGAMEVAGFFAELRLERTSYPEEIETRRASPAGATPNFEPGRVRTGHGWTTE